MRIRQLKKEVAVLLAFIMSCSTAMVPRGPVLTASAAVQKQVKLNVKSKTLKAGQKGYKLKLVNNKQGWKIKKVTTSNAAVCKPYGKKNTYVLLKGKGKGSATIQVKVTRTVLKKGKKTTKSKQLSCKVRVKAVATKAPDTEQTQVEDVTASSQEQLEAALNNAATKTIRFQTEAEGTFTIPKADYPGIDLIVDAPNADVENNGTFKSISVQAIKDSTWLENAVGNFLNVLAKTARIVVSQGADVNGIAFAQTGAKVALEVKGSVKEVAFQSPDTDAKVSVSQGSSLGDVSVEGAAQRTKVDMDVSGSVGDVKLAAPQSDMNMAVADGGVVSKVSLDAAAESAKVDMDVKGTVSDVSLDAPKADVKMAVNENGKVNGVTVSKEMDVALSGTTKTAIALKVSASATITASTDVALESSVSLNLTLEKGAEGSSVKVTGNIAAVGIKIQNKTESNISVSTPTGNITVNKNSNRDVTVNAPSTSGGSTSGGSSSGGSTSGGSSSGGSTSGGSSSGGSSSGGSESEGDKTDGTLKGITVDQPDLTMNAGEEKEVYYSADPKEAGKLERIQWNTVWNFESGYCQPYYDKEKKNGLKIIAKEPGIFVSYVAAHVIGNEVDSPILFPNQAKAIVTRVLGDNVKETPSSSIKLTAEAASIEKGKGTRVSVEIDKAPEGSKIVGDVAFISAWTNNGPNVLEFERNSAIDGTMTGKAMGKDEVVACATVELSDGTQEEVVSNVVAIEVTDSSPDPTPEETGIYLRMSQNNLRAEEDAQIYAYFSNRDQIAKARFSKIKWSSSDPSVIKIKEDETTGDTSDNPGRMIGVAVGKATVTAEVTIVTASQTFTKETSMEFEVEGEPAVPELTIASSVHVVSEGAIENNDGSWKHEDLGKVAFVFLTKDCSVTSADKVTLHNLIVKTDIQIDGLRTVPLNSGHDGYGFVIQEQNVTNASYEVPIEFSVKRDGADGSDAYTATVSVTVTKKAEGTYEAVYKVTDVKANRSGQSAQI